MSENTKNSPVRKLCITGLLIALSVVVGIVCKNLFTWQIYYRVTFENFPIILVGFCFGPVYGAAAGVIADLVSCLCSTNPAVNPIITAGAACVGLCAGLVPIVFRSVRRRAGKLSLALSVAAAHLFGQVIIKSIGKIVMFGMPWVGIFIGLGISCAVGIAEFFLLLVLLRNPEIKKTLRGISDYEL